jgi:hypothetical protein
MSTFCRSAAVSFFCIVTGCGGGVVTTRNPGDHTPPSEGTSTPGPANQQDAGASRPDDGGTRDAGRGVDGAPDAGTRDAGRVDADGLDAGRDAGSGPDAGTLDAGTRDAGSTLDAGRPDAGSPIDAGTLPSDGGADVTLTIDTSAQVRPISRFIYGKNFNGSTWQNQPHLTLNRLGGNRWSAYNWENNASNAGSDYNFQNDAYLGGGNVAGEAVRAPVATSQSFSGATIVTVPMAGWVAADKLGTSVSGQALATRFRQDTAVKATALVYPPVLTDAEVYQDEFVSWLEQQFPTAHQDPNREVFYSLDNEPDLWAGTHSEIHPLAVTYAELLSKSVGYAATVKRVAPAAKVFGAVSYGFNGYVNLQNAPDSAGRDFIDFFLDGVRVASTTAGVRLIDVLDLHWYPEAQGGGARVIGEGTTAALVAARVQAPRSLWDPTYVESSWIASYLGNQPIRLVPSMQAKIAAHYAGTRLAFTEYYFGGGAHISGAVAQADVLGIFGREGVFAAALWPMTSDIHFIDAAFRMFRNFDGAGANFGETSVSALTSDVAAVTIYASLDATHPGRVVLVAINKASVAKTAALRLTHPVSLTTAEVYQLTSAAAAPVRGTDVLSPGNAFSLTLPAMSVTTLLLRP